MDDLHVDNKKKENQYIACRLPVLKNTKRIIGYPIFIVELRQPSGIGSNSVNRHKS
jgi:hypothetical protein